MSIYELFHYSLFLGLFVAFTYNKKQPPAFGTSPAFWCILLSFVLITNAPFFYQISGTLANHEGSILSWCRIPSFYGFLLCYWGRPQSHNVSKRGGHRETLFYSFLSNFVKNPTQNEGHHDPFLWKNRGHYLPSAFRGRDFINHRSVS